MVRLSRQLGLGNTNDFLRLEAIHAVADCFLATTQQCGVVHPILDSAIDGHAGTVR